MQAFTEPSMKFKCCFYLRESKKIFLFLALKGQSIKGIQGGVAFFQSLNLLYFEVVIISAIMVLPIKRIISTGAAIKNTLNDPSVKKAKSPEYVTMRITPILEVRNLRAGINQRWRKPPVRLCKFGFCKPPVCIDNYTIFCADFQ